MRKPKAKNKTRTKVAKQKKRKPKAKNKTKRTKTKSEQAAESLAVRPLTVEELTRFFQYVRKDANGRVEWTIRESDPLRSAFTQLLNEVGIETTDGHGCWHWEGGKSGRKSGPKRPVFSVGKKKPYAYRSVLATYLRRELQPDMQADHRCLNGQNCVRPDHCLPLSKKEHDELTTYDRAADIDGSSEGRIVKISKDLTVFETNLPTDHPAGSSLKTSPANARADKKTTGK